jgi:hypothetical protein
MIAFQLGTPIENCGIGYIKAMADYDWNWPHKIKRDYFTCPAFYGLN